MPYSKSYRCVLSDRTTLTFTCNWDNAPSAEHIEQADSYAEERFKLFFGLRQAGYSSTKACAIVDGTFYPAPIVVAPLYPPYSDYEIESTVVSRVDE